MTAIQLIGFLWFASAIFIYVVGSLVFLFWLKKLGVRLIFGFRGIPGYAEYAYLNWCKSQKCSPTWILVLRGLSFANVILAAIVVIPMIIAAHAK
jgi:hypothetical protein